MPAPIRIDQATDPRLADYVALTDTALRQRAEVDAGLFIAEGELVIRRAASAGYRLRSMLLDARLPGNNVADLAGLAGEAPVYVAAPAVLEAVTGFHVHRGALASVARRPLPAAVELLAGARRVAVLESVNNHTNLGAVVRTAAGLGWDALLLDPRTVDPLYRRAVRVSMGAIFTLPYARLAAWPDGLAEVKATGFQVLALTPDAGAEPLEQVAATRLDRVAVLLGAEGPGLSETALALADRRVRIPMASGVDSLNVAAAAAVALWALR